MPVSSGMRLSRLAPRDVFVAAFFVMAAAAFAAPARYESVVFDQVDVKSDVPFHTATNVKGESEVLKLDIYQPAGDTARNRPAILWLHGGGFRPGNDKKQRYIVTMSTEFAKRGYVCVSSDYRVRTEQGPDRLAVLRDAVDDGQAALAWIRSQAKELGVDARRIAVGGGSAGGVLGVSLVARENTVAAKNRTAPVFAFINLWGSPREDFMLGSIDEHFPPTVIVHGTADQSVPIAHSKALVARLKAEAIRHELMAIPGAPHTPMAHTAAYVKTTAAFVFAELEKQK